ncbi:MAG: type III-B CRISPR module-associated Cmr3 family protein [Candidatus Electrothrix aestuarii]|uniref:Type III-B CRISPR module-associated Cmr3 family protein n=1 Tax=Candidatus Electrothrix aestuarii TaxID=3062594 RepID=A0AAU8LY21_9BACT|nr:type III-B CRISPR module-associated Cmr3 family protein [Candidatus Electrothrix aestuarii]
MSDKSNNSPAYLFEPKSPLVFRTGRPFDQAGDPVSLDFPLPSTLAGACRTAIGDVKGWDFAEKIQELKDTPVHGPLAALITEDGATQPLFPKPADAAYMREQGQKNAEVLHPRESPPDTWSDLQDKPGKDLELVYLPEDAEGKPVSGAGWWNQTHLTNWLLGKGLPAETLPEDLGWSGPQQELRTHVQLESKTFAAATGQLFQTNNLSFAPGRLNKDENRHEGWGKEQYGLLAHLPNDDLKETAQLFRRIGGEGRIAHMKQHAEGWPGIPEALTSALGKLEQGKELRGIRLVLATPALFTYGWRPGWIKDDMIGCPPGFSEEDKYTICLRLKAFITPRWEPVSGWDLVKNSQDNTEDKQDKKGKGAARAVRRMVPAGAVYWFEVEQGHKHLPKLWLQPISDLPQDRNDGYGLVLPGIWKR